MNVVSLCSGVGLIDLGLEWAGYRTVQFCEINPFGQRILAERFPGVPIHDDAWTIEPRECDVIAAGFPCQPFSVAGKGLGADDPRHLWPAIIRAVRLARPRYVILENVPGLVARGLGDVLGDLADAGFDAEWSVFSAAEVGALHLRRRVWIVATSGADSVRLWDEHGGFFREGWGSSAIAWAHGTARLMADTDRVRELQQGGIGIEGQRGWVGNSREQSRDVPDADGERCAEGVQRTTGHRSRTGDAERRRAVANVADAACKCERESADETHTVTGGGHSWPESRGGSVGGGGWWAAEPDVRGMADGSTTELDSIGGLNAHASCIAKARAKGASDADIVRTVWGDEKTATPPSGPRECGICRRPLPVMSRHSRDGSGDMGTWKTSADVVCDMRSGLHGRENAYQEQNVFGGVPIGARPSECHEAVGRRVNPWAIEPNIHRVAPGVAHRMDRLSALGNGVVPQCAELIGLRLQQLDSLSG